MLTKPISIAVIADTHVNRLQELPSKLIDTLTQADVIIHLGDYSHPELLTDLRNLGSFYGVIGNHDNLIARSELKVMEVVEIGGKKLGLIHGLFIPMARPKRIRSLFRKHQVDILLFGHTHMATCRVMDGVLLFNPGTASHKFPATYGSFGILTLKVDGSISTQIVTIEDPFPVRERFWMRFWALFIRNGIRSLEAWPYVDFRHYFSLVSITIKKRLNPPANSKMPFQ